MLIRNIPSYDDQITQLKDFVEAREDVITFIDTNTVNRDICLYLTNNSINHPVESFLSKLVNTDQEDIEALKIDEKYHLILLQNPITPLTRWKDDYAQMLVEIAAENAIAANRVGA